ncbi:MAG TPA: histidinol-phosphatase HisJ [Chondromyces sp.]|nr:histidinol-phosphatase HisJ [Chondromyces sp.]
MKVDGHIHTPYCPHGTNDSFKAYVERAIQLGFKKITFTEHAPLPKSFEDSTPTKDSGMKQQLLEAYLGDLNMLKKQYAKDITIGIGLEVDFIEGFEEETKSFLNEYGPLLDDSILSVHFLRHQQNWHCLDYSSELFGEITELFGSVAAVYEKYFQTVAQSIKADLGPYKPRRIGHITLVKKFQKQYSCPSSFQKEIKDLLHLIKREGYELDYNGAGVVKPLCGETYPPADIAREAFEMGIPLVYGSDAHQAGDLGQGLEQIDQHLVKSLLS